MPASEVSRAALDTTSNPRPAAEIGVTQRTAEGLYVTLRALDPAASWLPGWRDLSRRALVPNLFYDPSYALAAAPAFGAGVRALVVSDRPLEQPAARLLALWPIRRERLRWGVPLGVLTGWKHRFAVFGAPLVDRERNAEGFDGLLQAPRLLALPPRLLMTYAPSEGAFAEALDGALARHGLREARHWVHERALLAPDGRADYFAGHLSSRKRRKLGQQFRRLEAKGPAVFETVTERAAVLDGLEEYIALEAAGWKGRKGTAVACVPEEGTFLRQAVSEMAREGRVRIDRLRLNGRTIASSITFLTGTRAWYLKISFDEAEAKNSPGSQLVMRATESFLADPDIAAADSCAPPDYELMNTLWAERLSLSNRLLEAVGGDPLFPVAAGLESARARAISAVLAWRTGRQPTHGAKPGSPNDE